MAVRIVDADGDALLTDDPAAPSLPSLIALHRSGSDVENALLAPLKLGSLTRALQRVAGAHTPRPEAPGREHYPTARVLLAEDNSINQMVATRILRKFDISCELASNGKESVELACATPFDLVLMDCQMPEMDGYEATCFIRQFEEGSGRARVPIVALTANAMSGDEERCLAAGMDGYLSKPIDLGQLAQVLDRWLGGKVQSEAAG